MRLTYAAKQLIKQVHKMDPTGVVAPIDRADGYGVWRTIAFDPATSEWLHPALQACQDERIEDLQMDDGRLVITFVPDIRADQSARFLIEEADAVLRGDTDD